uniref:Dual specificity phosphatase catalytic domain-containing protein n=1 Tax=Panagrolaimus sp. PS1159 TaxID=55785 RepID=A0AC35G1D9_9BILA
MSSKPSGRFMIRVNLDKNLSSTSSTPTPTATTPIPPPALPSSASSRRTSVFSNNSPNLNSAVPDNIDEYSIILPSRLSEYKPSLRNNSMPSMAHRPRHMSAGSIGSRRGTTSSNPPSDSISENGSIYGNTKGFNHRMSTANSQSGSGVVDSTHIQLYLPRRDSVTSPLGEVISIHRLPSSESSQDEQDKLIAEEVLPKPESPVQTRPMETWRRLGKQITPQTSTENNGIKQKSHYIGEIVFQLNDGIYFGGIESSLNHNLLCRLNIEFIIDVSGPESDNMLRTRTEVPCLCGRQTPHSRTTLAIRIRDDSVDVMKPEFKGNQNAKAGTNSIGIEEEQDITDYFEEAITYIQRSIASGKSVLIYSLKCRNRAPSFAAAWFMHEQGLTRMQAIAKVSQIINDQLKTSKIRPGLCISDNMQRALRRWQTRLSKRNITSPKPADNGMMERLFGVRKGAWS